MPLRPLHLIKTVTHKTLSDIIDRVRNETADCKEKEGIIIEGPKGTGKSSALYYMMHILREEIVLLISPDHHDLMKTYLSGVTGQVQLNGKFAVVF